MGRNLLLNMAEHGFAVAGYDKDPQKVAVLRSEAAGLPVQPAEDVGSFVTAVAGTAGSDAARACRSGGG